MKKILILGATGMLGNAVARYFLRGDYDVTTTSRNPQSSNELRFDALNDSADSLPIGYDYVINCIGVIKPYAEADIAATVKVNAIFPHELSRHCEKHGMRLIHITTDCVYSGNRGLYSESSLHDALDVYGKSKSLGEPCANAMVLRTSIIGLETNHFASLISWAFSQKGKTIDGYTTHHWNGITTQQYAKVCEQIITQNLYQTGLHHIFAQDDVTKHELLYLLNKRFNLNLTINHAAPNAIDRRLRTEKKLNATLQIPTIKQMLDEMEEI